MLKYLIMRTLQSALVCFIFLIKGYSQTVTKSYGRVAVEITKEKKSKKVYTRVEIKSAFPGGDSAWVQLIEKKITESIQAYKRVKPGKYIVTVNFTVEKEGYFDDFICENDPGFGICEEVIRVLKKTKKWIPGEARPYRTSSTTLQVSNLRR